MKKQLIPILLLCLLYLLPGLIGHDPFKQDETYSFSIILNILQTGDWVVPSVAGDPFMEKPPLYYLSAAVSAWLFSAALPLHDGARLVNLFWFALALWALYKAHQVFVPEEKSHNTVLLWFLAPIGLVTHAHTLFTDVALLASCALAWWGLALIDKQLQNAKPNWRGAVLFGMGVGMALMCKGVMVPGVFALTVIMWWFFLPHADKKALARQIAVAVLASLPWVVIWPLALWLRSPTLFMDWFWDNNIGRFVGFSVPELGADNEPWYYVKVLPTFLFPTGIAAAFLLWQKREQFLSWKGLKKVCANPALFLPISWCLLISIVMINAASARALYALPLLPPLALLAAQIKLPSATEWPQAAKIATVVGRLVSLMFVVLSLGVVWAWWQMLHGHGAALPAFITRVLPSEYVLTFSWPHFLGACAVWLVWLGVIGVDVVRSRKANALPLRHWVAGVALLWGTAFTLCLPWINEAKSYRTMFAHFATTLKTEFKTPNELDCIASINLGESERAMLDYFQNIRTVRFENNNVQGCAVLLVQGGANDGEVVASSPEFKLFWRGARMGDMDELYWAYKITP